MRRWRVLALASVSAILAAVLAGLPAGAASGSAGSVTYEQLASKGKVTVRDLPTTRGSAGPASSHETTKGDELEKEEAVVPEAPLPVPTPPNTSLNKSTTGFSGFDGITHRDQRLAGGGNQFSLEPPDQGLCVGNGFVFESVNDALRIYNTSGTPLTGVITQSQFYGLPPTINRTTGVFGPFLSDPKCYFDPDTGRWFHSILEIDQNRQTGAFGQHAAVLLAVSTTGDPTGSFNLYEINATDPSHSNCPCFGDQPLIGADAYGFYVSTAEYDLNPFGGHFNGPQIYAMNKVALEAGSLPTVVHIADLGDHSGTVQPATSPNGVYRTTDSGTEFFMSGYDTLPPDGRLRPGQFNLLDVWGLIDTQSLTTATPSVSLSKTTLTTEVFGQPPPQTQEDGTRPLGSSLGEPNPVIESNDDRMNQVVFAADKLWGGINTIIGGEATPRTGVAWFIVTPGISNGQVTASISQQGYIAVAKSHVSFPSIGVNGSGQGAVVFTLMSPKDFPSFAYVPISLAGLGSAVHLAKEGALPEDGFTCYPEFVGSGAKCRWGDYSAAVAVGSDIWMATEYIPDAPRTDFANWGTFVGKLSP
jgi:hypothetical protein